MDPPRTVGLFGAILRVPQFLREASIPEITAGFKKMGMVPDCDGFGPWALVQTGAGAVARRFLERCKNRWKRGHAKTHRFNYRHCAGGQCPKDRDGKVRSTESDAGRDSPEPFDHHKTGGARVMSRYFRVGQTDWECWPGA